jgi:hypothetical protein
MEPKYNCSGICNTPLFYYTLDLSYGQPTTTCQAAMLTEIGGTLYTLGILALAGGAAFSLIWCC